VFFEVALSGRLFTGLSQTGHTLRIHGSRWDLQPSTLAAFDEGISCARHTAASTRLFLFVISQRQRPLPPQVA
jgi:hypothetical protein